MVVAAGGAVFSALTQTRVACWEPKRKKLWLKDGESVKTAIVIFALTMSAIASLIVFWSALFG